MALVVKSLPANAGDIRDTGSIPGSGRSAGEGNCHPLQYFFFLEDPWTKEPGGLQSIGLQRVGPTWSDLAHYYYHLCSFFLVLCFSVDFLISVLRISRLLCTSTSDSSKTTCFVRLIIRQNCFNIFQWLRKRIFHGMKIVLDFLKHEIQISVTINTVLLDHSQHLFTYSFSFFRTTMAEVNSWNKLHPTKPQVFNSVTLSRSLPAPDVWKLLINVRNELGTKLTSFQRHVNFPNSFCWIWAKVICQLMVIKCSVPL